MTTKAAIYVRISQNRTGDAAGVKRQEEDCRELAERLDWTVVEGVGNRGDGVYSDNDISASTGRPRPAYEQLWEDVRAGRIDAVLAYHPKRLYRRLHQLDTLIELVKEIEKSTGRKIQIKTAMGGELDLSTSVGRAFALVMAVFAQLEIEEMGERISGQKKSAREQGRYSGGKRPFGYNVIPPKIVNGKPVSVGLVVNGEEAKLIREALTRIMAGEAPNRIVLDWNARGIKAAGGGRWSPSRLRRILLGEHGKERGKDRKRATPLLLGGSNWPPILTEDEIRAIYARLEERAKYRPNAPGMKKRYPLSGLVYCAVCGSRLMGSGGFYRCATRNGGAGCVSVQARMLEQYIDLEIQRERERGRARDPKAAPDFVVDEEVQAEALAKMASMEARHAELMDAVANGSFAVGDIRGALDRIEAGREEAASRYAEVSPTRAGSVLDLFRDPEKLAELEAWRERFETGELSPVEVEDFHEMFEAYIEKAIVKPATKRGIFDPERIAVTWRD